MQTTEIKTAMGHSVHASIFGNSDCQSVLVIASATGVKQQCYHKFATYVAQQQIAVITFDYLGIGDSLKKSIKTLQHNAYDWGNNDLEAVIQFAHKEFPSTPLCLLGHSIGGQLIGLTPSSMLAKKIILVSAQSGYWKYWTGMAKLKMWATWYLLFPLLIKLFGYVPSKKITGMENLPKYVAWQWRTWCTQPNYLLSEIPQEKRFYHKIHAPITAFSVEDDEFAPRAAVKWLTNLYNQGLVDERHLIPEHYEAKSINHFGIFREKFQNTLWPLVLKEINPAE